MPPTSADPSPSPPLPPPPPCPQVEGLCSVLSLLLDQGVAQQLQQQAASAAGEAAMAEADTLLAAGAEAEEHAWAVDLAGDLMAQVGRYHMHCHLSLPFCRSPVLLPVMRVPAPAAALQLLPRTVACSRRAWTGMTACPACRRTLLAPVLAWLPRCTCTCCTILPGFAMPVCMPGLWLVTSTLFCTSV